MNSSDRSMIWVENLRMLANSATPGPWHIRRVDDPSFMAAYYLTSTEGNGALDVEEWDHPTSVVAITLLQDPNLAVASQNRENAEFIASARTAIPRLCVAIERTMRSRNSLARVVRAFLASAKQLQDLVGRDVVDQAQKLVDELERE